jgi:hypothetical protein
MIDNRLGALYFPPGRYRLNNTLVLRPKTAYHLVGCGLAKPIADQSGAKGAESVIFWGGTSTTDPIILYQGTGLVWNGLALWGCNLPGSSSSCPGARAKYGINVSKPATGPVGTGQAWFESILIANCDEAIATASETIMNCDTLAFGLCWFEDCGVGLHLVHEQALQFTFRHVYAEDCVTIFKVDDGGRIFTETVSVQSDATTVLELNGGGQNSAFHQLGGVTLAPGILDGYLLKSITAATSQGAHHVRFTDGHFVGVSPTTTARVEINRSAGMPHQGGGLSTLEFVGCRGMAALNGRVKLVGKIRTVNGQQITDKLIFFARDCELSSIADLIETGSDIYQSYGMDNWTSASGKVGDTAEPPLP